MLMIDCRMGFIFQWYISGLTYTSVTVYNNKCSINPPCFPAQEWQTRAATIEFLWQVTSDNPSGPFGNVLFYVILTISYCGRAVFSIETSSLPNDSARPLFKQIEIFLVDRLYILTASTFLYIRTSYQDASLISPSGRNPCGGTELRKMLRVFLKPTLLPL